VCDFGASGIRVTPIVDGYGLTNGACVRLAVRESKLEYAHISAVVQTDRGGEWIEKQLFSTLLSKGVQIIPRHELGGTNLSLHESFRSMCVQDIVQDMKHCLCRVPERPLVRDSSEIDE
jgi:hypothetical protein